MKDLILVDTSWVIHRSWHVHQDLSTHLKNGTELKTGHVYGVVRLLKSLTTKYPDATIVLCLDGVAEHGKSLSADYKANRSHGSVTTAFEDLGVIVNCALAFKNTYVAYNRHLEADEIMSYLVYKNRDTCDRIIVYSADGDMLQLLAAGRNIFIAKEFNHDGELVLVDEQFYLTNPKYLDKFCGVDPKALPRYRAIIGDSSDNLGGFPRMRKKVAKEIAEKYRTTDEIAKGCLDGDPLFPEGFDKFLGKLVVNHEIMKLPTSDELTERGDVPHLFNYSEGNQEIAKYLYSLYKIRTATPVQFIELDADGEDIAMKMREAVNYDWRHPNSDQK